MAIVAVRAVLARCSSMGRPCEWSFVLYTVYHIYMYISTYIYREGERERERESPINRFTCQNGHSMQEEGGICKKKFSSKV